MDKNELDRLTHEDLIELLLKQYEQVQVFQTMVQQLRKELYIPYPCSSFTCSL